MFYLRSIFTISASVKHGYRSNNGWILPLGFFCKKVTLSSLVALSNCLICLMFLDSAFFFHSVFSSARCLVISSSVVAITWLVSFTSTLKQVFLGVSWSEVFVWLFLFSWCRICLTFCEKLLLKVD